MAHLLAPKPPEPKLPIFYNVDGVVGASPAQNLREDVLFVQFAYRVIATAPLSVTNPEVLEAARAVQLTGVIDDATIHAIRATQQRHKKKIPGTVVDGRVSPARGGYSYGGGLWTIAFLNDSIQSRHLDIWPRIDKIPGCPAEITQMVIRQVVGVS